jgi:hypothetical protein
VTNKDKDAPQPTTRPNPGDPGKIGTEPVVREPKLPWAEKGADPGKVRTEKIPFERRSRPNK